MCPRMELSIIVPSRNGHDRLPKTLEALADCFPPAGGFEVIVIDDGSMPPLAVPHGEPQRICTTVVRLSPNRGRASACNAGLRAARGRVVLILDDDMSLHSDALVKHVAAHPASAPPCAVVARIVPGANAFHGRFGQFLKAEEERRRAKLLSSAVLSFEDCLTGHFSVPRETLLRVGGYEERFDRYGMEDLELALRLKERGVPLTYRDDIVAAHRSAAVDFVTHCRRHLDSGRMARLFASVTADPAVAAFLRIDGMSVRSEHGCFRRTMAATHSFVRRLPRPLVGPTLGAARLVVLMAQPLLPPRILHVGYHLVRDMHYAAGVAASCAGAGKPTETM